MVVKALRHKKIVHKRTNRFHRFESEDYTHRLAFSWRRPRGNPQTLIDDQVSITECVVDSPVTDPCPRAVSELITQPGIVEKFHP